MRPHDPQRNPGNNDQRLPNEDVGIVEVLGQKNTDVEKRHDAHQIDELDGEQAADDPDQFGGRFGREGKHPGNENQTGDQPVAAVVNGDREARRRDDATGDRRLFTEDAEDEARHLSNDGRVGRNEGIVDLPQCKNSEAHTEDCQEQDEETSFRLLPQIAKVHTPQSEIGTIWDVNGTEPLNQRTAHWCLHSGPQGPFPGSAE